MDPDSYARAYAVLQDCDEVDAILLTGYFGGYSSGEDGLTGLGPAECAAAKQISVDAACAKPTAVQSIFPDAPACQILRDGAVPVFAAIEDAVTALAAVTDARPPQGLTPLPRQVDPVSATDYMASRKEFAATGIDFVAAREVRTGEELAAAADELRGPWVLKALGLLHKSDAGGVVVGIEGRQALLDAHARLVDKLDPPSFSVEEMADLKGGIELIVGARWDARFGPIVLVGMGGTATEVLRDVQIALAPVDEAGAARMLKRLRTAAMLDEHRGRPAVDVAAAARAVARLSRYAAAHPEIAELEINPLLVTPSGATALDARIVKNS
jgi:acyl-CoA synthetase (NDP forming)